ncbi:MAG: DUF480 domain-containing protein [Gammaproteobacteria bacterium]
MTPVLTAVEARVIGSLMEKEVTTPEQYPLSLNSLMVACNQKSNRDPLMDVGAAELQATVDGLMKRHLVSDRSGYGGRVPKYKQIFCNTNFGPLQFTDPERAIICELLLRGPQSAGELRTRCQRMTPVADVAQVDAAHEALASHEMGPFVVKLSRRSGARDPRWMHLLGQEALASGAAPTVAMTATAKSDAGPAITAVASAGRPALADRVTQLEAEVAALRRELETLASQLPPG